jgi:hypothetical protein
LKNPWLDLALLTAESQQVILLRMMKLAGGGAGAQAELRLMTSEKVSAMGEAGIDLMTGGDADSVVRGYRRKVRANLRRLSK